MMEDIVEAITQNLPELLARDLASSEDVFLARSITSGPPLVNLAYEAQPPRVPRRNPSRVAARTSHRVTPEPPLCSPRQNTMETSRRHGCRDFDKAVVSPLRLVRTQGQNQMLDNRNTHMKQDSAKDEGRLFLNGLDEDWGSDSSADMEAGLSSPSVRTRKQSVTTAATSVDIQFVSGGKTMGGCSSVAGSPRNPFAKLEEDEGESWVDIEPEMSTLERDLGRGVVPSGGFEELGQSHHLPLEEYEEEELLVQNQQPLFSVPKRRSSLSHQVTTVGLGERAPSRKTSTHNFTQELASQLLYHSTQNSSHYLPSYHPLKSNWDDSEAALAPVVPTGRHQNHQHHQLDLPTTVPDQLSLPPLHIDSTVREATYDNRQPQARLLTKSRKPQNSSTTPMLTVIHNWLETSSGARADPQSRDPITPNPRNGMAPHSGIRLPSEVVENLRISIAGFPSTMLSTNSLTLQAIRSYSHKIKRGEGIMERVPTRDGDKLPPNFFESSTTPKLPSLGRKASLGNLKLINSLRGKLGTRLSSSATSPSSCEKDDDWPPTDRNVLTIRCNTPPQRSLAAQVEGWVNSLRSIFPNGSDFLLDGMYAHLVAYNYINSLCGGFPHLHQQDADPHLQNRPSTNFVLPAGVTSLNDLKLHPDSDENAVQAFQDDIANTESRARISKKAASILGIGATNMGAPVKPPAGTLGGRQANMRKTTPPGASFTATLESEAAMHRLRDDIAHNIYRLVETVKKAKRTTGKSSNEEDENSVVAANGKELDSTFMRALCEVVRCYEEFGCATNTATRDLFALSPL